MALCGGTVVDACPVRVAHPDNLDRGGLYGPGIGQEPVWADASATRRLLGGARRDHDRGPGVDQPGEIRVALADRVSPVAAPSPLAHGAMAGRDLGNAVRPAGQ